MSSTTPDTNLWLERSRFNGMLLGGVSYGIFFLLTIQTSLTLLRKSRQQHGPLTTSRMILLTYIAITFVLATIGFSGNAKYTQTIWIDMRDAPSGPALLIDLELDYWVNRMALACYYVMESFMEALLLYRCFVIWNRNPVVVVFMTTLFLASVAMSILVLTESKGAVFYNINVQLAYLCIAVGTNIIYTILVAGRILATRNEVREVMGKEHAATYTSVIAVIVESAAMYSILGILYIISFATHSNLSNLIFLSISHVQGIAQLLIILRVAKGHAYTPGITSQSISTIQFDSDAPYRPNFNMEPQSTTGMGTVSTGTTQREKSTTTNLRMERSRETIGSAE